MSRAHTDLLVTGCYRSGTTLLEKLLHQHPQVTVASQPMPALYHVVKQRFLDARGLDRRYPLDHMFLEDAYTSDELSAFLASYRLDDRDLDLVFSQLSRHAEGHWTPEISRMRDAFAPGPILRQLETLRKCIVDLFPKTEPQAYVGSKEIVCEELIPFLIDNGCTCIISIRDPRDVVASVNFGLRYASMGDPRPVLYTLRAWRKSVAFALAFEHHPKVRVVRYEKLAARPEGTMLQLFESLGLPPVTASSAHVKDQYGASWSGNSSFSDAADVSAKPVGRYARVLPPDVLRYAEAACLPELRALGMQTTSTRRFHASALTDYRSTASRVHAKFPADYDHTPEHIAEETQRYAHALSGNLPQDQRAAWFIHPKAYAKLRAPRLLFLGAGPNQLPAIQAATELGWHVTTVDNLADSPGHRIAHAREHCSTTNVAGILAIARRLEATGVATFASDVAAPTVAQVAAALGLPGAQPDAVAQLSQKSGLRRIQEELGLPAPRFIVASTYAQLVERLPALYGQAVFKPEDASGSKGISAADVRNVAACQAAFAYAQQHSRCGSICVEEYLEGSHLSADGYIEGGRIVQMVCTEKQRMGFQVRGHVVPSAIGDRDEKELRRQVESLAAHVGLESGFFDLDAVVTATGPVLIEISPRLGGNGIPTLLACAADLRLTDASLLRSMGEPFALSCVARPRRMASWVFGAPSAGTLTGIADEDAVRKRVPELEHLLIGRAIGERVKTMENGADLVGYAVFSIPEGSSFDDMTERLATALQIEVRESP